MKSLIIKILIGIAVGIACKVIGDQVEKFLLKRRGLEFKRGKKENILVFVLTAVFGALIVCRMESYMEMAYVFLLMILAQAITEADIHHRVIPNGTLLAIFALKILFGAPYLFEMEKFPKFVITDSLIGMFVSFVIFIIPAFMSKQVGAGDIKLAATMGFVLGFAGCMTAIIIMGFMVVAYSFLQKEMPLLVVVKTMIPMGPFLAIAMIIVLLLPEKLFSITI